MNAERAAASHFSETRNTLQSVCAVNMIQASLFTDTLHVENIHHPNFLQPRSISPLSRLQNKKKQKKHKHPNDRTDGAKWQKTKNNIYSLPSLPPSCILAAILTPLLTCTKPTARGLSLISSPPGNQHFNNSLRADEGI